MTETDHDRATVAIHSMARSMSADPPGSNLLTAGVRGDSPLEHAGLAMRDGHHRQFVNVDHAARADRIAISWQKHQAELLRLAAALGAGTSLPGISAADVAQDVFVAAKSEQTELGKLNDDEIKRWMFRVAVNRCRLEGRKQTRWRRVWQAITGGKIKPLPTDPLPVDRPDADLPERRASVHDVQRQDHHAETPYANAALREERQRVCKALDGMPPALREVLVLRYFHDHNSREIARILNTKDSTIRGRLRKARKTLASALNTDDPKP